MLDLDHPMSEHRFSASRAQDRVLNRAKRMTLVPTQERLKLLEECRKDLQEMRQINNAYFQESPFISSAIQELDDSLQKLATLKGGKITEDKSDGVGRCPACNSQITKFKTEGLTRAYFERVKPLMKEGKDVKDLIDLLTPRIGERGDYWHIYCDNCLDLISSAREKLDSPEGFATCFI